MKNLLYSCSQSTLLKRLSIIAFSVFIIGGSGKIYAQPPQPHTLYLQYGSTIYDCNVTNYGVGTNTISCPGEGLAITTNYFSSGPNPTFYTVVNGIYEYWNGTSWASTGYSSGSTSAVNPGGAGKYLYNVNFGSTVYRTDLTTGTTTTFLNLNGWDGPWDCVGDMDGHLYLFNTNTNELNVYDTSGNIICTYPFTGIPPSNMGGGFGIVDGQVYIETNPNIWVNGTVTPTGITFSNDTGKLAQIEAGDYASAPLVNGGDSVIGDTSICLGDTTTYSIFAGGGKGIWHTLDSTIATVDTNGLVTGISSGTTTILYVDTAPSNGLPGCLSSGSTDTGQLVIHINPFADTALTNPISPQTFCTGSYFTLALAGPSNSYTYQWTKDGQNVPPPQGNQSSITLTNPGDYNVIITTNKGCKDTSKTITVFNTHVHIDFTIQKHLGCTQDTVQMVNSSEDGTAYKWNFGDNSYPLDTTRNPSHIYSQQGTYQIELTLTNDSGCTDSLIKFVNTSHPLQAAFTVDKDSLCQGTAAMVHFTNQSVGESTNQWDFGDGATGQNVSPSHHYTLAGSHMATLIASDTIGCHDTAYQNIYVDSLPFLRLTANKNNFCTGEKVYLHLDYLAQTATQVNWNFGDGIHWEEAGDQTHDYDRSGQYQIIVSADYLVCPSANDTLDVTIHDMPTVYLGPDTVLCLQGDPITLKNLSSGNDPTTQYKWNTGDTMNTLTVVHPGIYTLTATAFDCSTTESVKIEKDCYTDIPNAFTPNGDGVDDYFFPRQLLSKGVVGFTLDIYNRWGEKIFETENANGRGWDGKFNGKPQPNGVYIYQINVIYHNGRTEKYTGNITLLR